MLKVWAPHKRKWKKLHCPDLSPTSAQRHIHVFVGGPDSDWSVSHMRAHSHN